MILEKKCREYTLIKVIHIGLKELIKNSLYSYKPNVAYSNYVNPIPAVVFLHNSKSIGLRLLKFSDFS